MIIAFNLILACAHAVKVFCVLVHMTARSLFIFHTDQIISYNSHHYWRYFACAAIANRVFC